MSRPASQRSASPRRIHQVLCYAAVPLLLAVVWLVQWWRTPPAVHYENLKYIQLLRTAVSSRNADHVARVEQAVRQLTAAGDMSAAELAHFSSIISLSRDGAWEQADRRAFDFELAQLQRRR